MAAHTCRKNETPCLSHKTKCIIRMCFSTKRGRTLCASLLAPVLLALLLPILNVHVIYPAFKQMVLTSLEEDAERLGRHMLPPAMKHTRLTDKSMTPQMFGNIYRLENDFGLLKLRLFSTLGIILYSTNPDEIGIQNNSRYFQEIVAKGNTHSKLVTKDAKTLDGNTARMDVVEIYVPIMNQDDFLGATEMYFDVTKRLNELDELTSYSKFAMGTLSICLVILSLYLLRKEVKHQQDMQRHEILKTDVERITRHDMKSPVLSLLTGINYLEEYTELNADQAEMTAEMRRAANTAMNMINRSLDLYKMEVGTYTYTPSQMDLLAVTTRVISDLERFAQDMQVSVHVTQNDTTPQPDAIFPILAEESLCYSLIANLVKNAIEASPAGESVVVQLSDINGHQLAVHNSGTVPSEIRTNFFEKYVTAGKTTGTGLGTYSAKLMVETMNGTIDMTTSESDGTTVTVTLPDNQPKD